MTNRCRDSTPSDRVGQRRRPVGATTGTALGGLDPLRRRSRNQPHPGPIPRLQPLRPFFDPVRSAPPGAAPRPLTTSPDPPPSAPGRAPPAHPAPPAHRARHRCGPDRATRSRRVSRDIYRFALRAARAKRLRGPACGGAVLLAPSFARPHSRSRAREASWPPLRGRCARPRSFALRPLTASLHGRARRSKRQRGAPRRPHNGASSTPPPAGGPHDHPGDHCLYRPVPRV